MWEIVRTLNRVVVGSCQLLAMFVISVGIIKSLIFYAKDAFTRARSSDAIRESRLELGHSFSLGLGFLIGASILNTTIAPTWQDIGQLAAIIAIRTFLNYFLMLDISRDAKSACAEKGGKSAKPEKD